MTQQVTDPFIWEGKEYIFIQAQNVYSLFDPEEYGLHPDEISTACYKGFVIFFSVKEKQLFIDRLIVFCRDNKYPVINNVIPILSKDEYFYDCYEYNDLQIASRYSGVITIGDKLSDWCQGRAFIGPHCYEETYELTFVNGSMTDWKDTSGTYTLFD